MIFSHSLKFLSYSQCYAICAHNIIFISCFPSLIFFHQSWIFSLVILILYLTLTLIQAYAFVRQRTRNLLVYLFTISLEMYTLALFLNSLDVILFRSVNDEPNMMPLIVDILRISALVR